MNVDRHKLATALTQTLESSKCCDKLKAFVPQKNPFLERTIPPAAIESRRTQRRFHQHRKFQTREEDQTMATTAWTGMIIGTLAVAAAAAAYGYTNMSDTGTRSTGSTRTGTSAEARLLKYDTNRDGRITRPEVDGALAEEFRSVDTNSDGRLDAAELQRHAEVRRAERSARLEAWRAKARAEGLDPRKPPFDTSDRDNVDSLRYGDWNMDGAITPEEFGGRTRSQFMRSDRNADGLITGDEMRRRPNNR
jgi:hypothetical protein